MVFSSNNYPPEAAAPCSEAEHLEPGPARGKKRLLYLALSDPDLEVTGATVRMGAFVKHLSRYYDITLVNMSGSGHRVEHRIEERFRDRDNRLGITRRVRVKFSQTGYFLLSPALFHQARQLLRNAPFDYLLADYGLAGVYGHFLSRLHRIPLIYSAHNVEHRMYQVLGHRDFRRKLLAPYVYWAERAACKSAALVVAISPQDRSQFARWVPNERIEVVPQGFDPEVANPFYQPSAGNRPAILFVGSFRSENNRLAARRIVEIIMPEVLRVRPDVKFQLIGTDPPKEVRSDAVECPGFVDDLGPYLRRAHVVIAPMPFAQGMSSKIVLALAYGKSVLATAEAVAGFRHTYRQLSIQPVEKFAEKIVQLLGQDLSVDTGEFSMLCDEFAWPNLLARLYSRIENVRSRSMVSTCPEMEATAWH